MNQNNQPKKKQRHLPHARANEDVQAAMFRALESKRGIAIEFDTLAEAIIFRNRCGKIRRRDRTIALDLPPEHPKFGWSVFNILHFKIVDTTLHIIKMNIEDFNLTHKVIDL